MLLQARWYLLEVDGIDGIGETLHGVDLLGRLVPGGRQDRGERTLSPKGSRSYTFGAGRVRTKKLFHEGVGGEGGEVHA